MKNSLYTQVASRLWPGRDTRGFNSFDFIHAFASPLQALFYARLFRPDFDDYNDMTFLEGAIEDDDDRQRVDAALLRHGGDRTVTEQSFNAIEVPSLFAATGDTDDREDEILAREICASWSCRLRELFPGRQYIVEVLPPTSEGDEIAVRFYRRR